MGTNRRKHRLDALVFGYYEGKDLLRIQDEERLHANCVRTLMRKFKGSNRSIAHSSNLPEKREGDGAKESPPPKMKDCWWLRPAVVAQFEFVEWTPDNHLRHSKFVALRTDKKPTDVRRE